MSITAAQIRGARAMLGAIKQSDLADSIGVTPQAIMRIEKGHSKGHSSTLEKIKNFFEAQGVEFLGANGVRIEEGYKRLEGKEGFQTFLEMVLREIEDNGGELCVSNVHETEWEVWGTGYKELYFEKIKKLQNFQFKILIQEGDQNFVAKDYAEYRWMPSESFGGVPTYVFGDNVATLLFSEDNCVIHIIKDKGLADTQRYQFNLIWKESIPPHDPRT